MAKHSIPTEEDLRRLPRWAQVAFGARCARRVLPLFSDDWPYAPGQYAQAVERAVELAEQAAGDPAVVAAAAAPETAGDNTIAAAMIAAHDARDAADHAARGGHKTADLAARAAAAATDVSAADLAARAAAGIAAAGVAAAIRGDFDQLAAAATAAGWDDSTPVPPTVFGPLWPHGPPVGWPPGRGGGGRSRPPTG
jgi:hypothetical protein